MPSELWPVKWPTSFDKTGFDQEALDLAENFAAAVMRFLTLERVGGKTVTITAGYSWCRNRSRSNLFRYDFMLDSDYYLCLCGAFCECGRESSLELVEPVGRVDEVKVRGSIVPPDTYRVVDGKYLVLDSEVPSCGVEVTYLNGYPVDAMGQHAAGVLAVEYIKLVTGDKKCRLPSGITSISRQGISMEIASGLFPEGVTNITEVDTYVMLWNPNALRIRPKVYSPDIHPNRQTTWGR